MTSVAPSPAVTAFGLGRRGLVFGCDYNAEQWDRDVWHEDVRLMREAGVSLVAVNVFGWAQLERRPGEFSFHELDEVLDLLHANGIAVNLGTGTSSPPPWLSAAHPEILPVDADGHRSWPGGRQAWCPSSPVFRERSLALVTAVADRYADHPAVAMWHVSNELGCHNAHCYCDVSASAFRTWLERRYATVDALNDAWGTAFWSQRYGDWAEVLPPRRTNAFPNPAQVVDFARFSSDEVLGQYRAEAAALKARTGTPVTTNFMVTAHIRALDYWRWAPEMDLVANDHYLDHRLPAPTPELSFCADVTRGLAQGGPWLLMEMSTSAVNWQPRNHAKARGEMTRNALTHVARGADGVCFFQWRASARGAERFHSALLPHAGTDTAVWREVTALGELLGRLQEVAGTRVVADVALVFSWEAWWASDLDARPSGDVRYLDRVHALYEALWEFGVTVDVVAPGAPLDGYRLVVVPHLSTVSDADAAVVADFVAGGGHALVTFFSGVADETQAVRLGGYPGAFRDLLGIAVEEFRPLAPDERVPLSDGSAATLWSEQLALRGAEAVLEYTGGPLAGVPAVTRNASGSGTAWYLATALEPQALAGLLERVADAAGVAAAGGHGVEVVRRRGTDADYVFVVNHTDAPYRHGLEGHELVGDAPASVDAEVPAGGVHVVRQERAAAERVAPERAGQGRADRWR